jgi:hypothetical protein
MGIATVCSSNSSGAKPRPKPFSNAQTVRSAGVKHTAPYGPPATDAGRADVRPFSPQWSKADPDPAHGAK